VSETKVVIEISAEHTRIRVFPSAMPQRTLLQAELAPEPSHPRALQWLLEALSLWQGSAVHAVLVADESSDTYVSRLYPAWFSDFGGVLYTLEFHDARRARAVRRERERGAGR
jgi:hypothetical protein